MPRSQTQLEQGWTWVRTHAVLITGKDGPQWLEQLYSEAAASEFCETFNRLIGDAARQAYAVPLAVELPDPQKLAEDWGDPSLWALSAFAEFDVFEHTSREVAAESSKHPDSEGRAEE